MYCNNIIIIWKESIFLEEYLLIKASIVFNVLLEDKICQATSIRVECLALGITKPFKYCDDVMPEYFIASFPRLGLELGGECSNTEVPIETHGVIR